jgi:hypothetical protein
MFKFDGIGGGLGVSGAGEFVADFEAMLLLIQNLRRRVEAIAREEPRRSVLDCEEAAGSGQGNGKKRKRLWINLTIGSWPSPFWLFWTDSIWKDGIDVGQAIFDDYAAIARCASLKGLRRLDLCCAQLLSDAEVVEVACGCRDTSRRWCTSISAVATSPSRPCKS